MIIKSVSIKNFKKFNNTKFDFKDGINIIKGDNERGKSTLLKAITAGLFIDPSSSKYKELFKPWNIYTYPEIVLEFDANDNHYRLEKNFNTKESILISNDQQEKNLTAINKKIKEFTGFSNESIFKVTTCINQDEVSEIESGKKSLQEALQEISLSNGKINLITLLKSLKQKIDEMQIGLNHPAKNNGVIKTLRDKTEEKELVLSKMKEQEKGVGSSVDKLDSLNKELKDVDENILKYTKIVSDFEKNETIQKDVDVLEENIKRDSQDLEKIKSLEDKLNDLKKKYNDLGGDGALELLNHIGNEVSIIAKEIEEKTSEIDALRKQIPQKVEKKSNSNIHSFLFIAISVVCLLLITVGVLFYKPLIIAGIILECVYIGIYFYTKSTDKNIQDKEDDTLSSKINLLNNEISEKNLTLSSLLESCNVSSINLYYESKTHLTASHADISQSEATIKALLRERNYQELKNILKENESKRNELKSQINDNILITKDQYLKDKRELELLNLDKTDILREITEEKTKVKVVDISSDEISEKENELNLIKEDLKNNEHHLKVLLLVYYSLIKAKEEISVDITSRLKNYIKNNLSLITVDRYDEVKMDNDFNIEVFSKDKNDWINPKSDLSKGTIDQIYLISRLALSNLITENRAVPLFFDDPFLSFDSTRREKLIDLLKTISTKHQVFIFTCHNYFDACGNLINL